MSATSRARWRRCSSKPLAYVANTRQRHRVGRSTWSTTRPSTTIDVGTEPQAVVASPNGTLRLRRQRQRQHRAGDRHARPTRSSRPSRVGRSPRALAITNDGDADDLDESLYVPNFFARAARRLRRRRARANLGGADGAAAAFPAGANGQPVVGEGIFDDSREAVIDVVSPATNTVVDQVVLAPLADTGFNFARGAFVNTDADRRAAHDLRRRRHRRHRGAGRPAPSRTCCRASCSSATAASCPTPPPRPSRRCASTSTCRAWSRCSTSAANAGDRRPDLQHEPRHQLRPARRACWMRRSATTPSACSPRCRSTSTAPRPPTQCWVVSQGSDFIVRMDFDGTGKPTINAPTAPGPFAGQPGGAHLHHRSGRSDELGPQPARHRAQRRRHARLRRLPDDPRRHRRGSGRQHRPAARPLLRPADRSARAERSCAARSTSSPRARSGPTAAGAAAGRATRTAAPTR